MFHFLKSYPTYEELCGIRAATPWEEDSEKMGREEGFGRRARGVIVIWRGQMELWFWHLVSWRIYITQNH